MAKFASRVMIPALAAVAAAAATAPAQFTSIAAVGPVGSNGVVYEYGSGNITATSANTPGAGTGTGIGRRLVDYNFSSGVPFQALDLNAANVSFSAGPGSTFSPTSATLDYGASFDAGTGAGAYNRLNFTLVNNTGGTLTQVTFTPTQAGNNNVAFFRGPGPGGNELPSPGFAIITNPAGVNSAGQNGNPPVSGTTDSNRDPFVTVGTSSSGSGPTDRITFQGTSARFVFDAPVPNGDRISFYLPIVGLTAPTSGSFGTVTLNIAPVPEPATVLGLAAGGLGLARVVRRRVAGRAPAAA